ncbi:hypothetical protein HY500_04440 [Candidatus Woesearchaeota archaeon]|nr:hypothetical protein [Candidatus Woesearchaeota archaeon]
MKGTTPHLFRARTDRRDLAVKIALLSLIILPAVSVNIVAYCGTRWNTEDSAVVKRNLRITEVDSLRELVGYIYFGGIGEDLAYKNDYKQ